MKKYLHVSFAFLLFFLTSCSTEEPNPTYELTISIIPEGGGKVTLSPESTTFEEGKLVVLTPIPNSNFVFDSWGGDIIGNSNPIEVTMNSNKSIVAKFGAFKTAIVDVTNPKTGKTWMDRNLGATRAATSSTDVESYGDLYQWGRASDGHQLRNSTNTKTLSSSDQPANGNFIITNKSDWRSPQNNNLWQGISGINNPCPKGYRIPTEAEWNAERLSWGTNNATGAFNSPLKLPTSGGRGIDEGNLFSVGIDGLYWSSTPGNIDAKMANFSKNGGSGIDLNKRGYGFSVRCIKD
jgi:uncharacterized protein (TIGR02145 family)